MLKNSIDNERLCSEGYIILPNAITKKILSNLRSFYEQSIEQAKFNVYRDKGINHVNTAMSPSKAYKKNVLNIIKKELQPVIDELFEGFKIVIANYIIKYPGGENECKVHQDISLIEEDDTTSSYTIWFTLDTIDPKSSPLYAVPRTHRTLKNFVRGVGVTLNLNTYKDKLLPKATTLLPFNAGDILVMNPRVVHGSLPTPSNYDTRIAIGVGIIPCTKKHVLYIKENNEVKKYFVNEETMLNYNPEKKYKFKEKYEIVSPAELSYEKYKKILENI
ncbi:MAG: hypothetical protein EBU90_02470 [Proteobacteria bacterium]|nr:hypothetical protein [Pseudomonadota bacterium]NBP13100.1 hypothetical protein [bacterium]